MNQVEDAPIGNKISKTAHTVVDADIEKLRARARELEEVESKALALQDELDSVQDELEKTQKELTTAKETNLVSTVVLPKVHTFTDSFCVTEPRQCTVPPPPGNPEQACSKASCTRWKGGRGTSTFQRHTSKHYSSSLDS